MPENTSLPSNTSVPPRWKGWVQNPSSTSMLCSAAQTTFPKSSKRCPNTAISIKVTLGCRAERHSSVRGTITMRKRVSCATTSTSACPMLNPIGSILPSATTCAATRIPGRNISSLKYSWHSSTALMWTPTASIKPNLSGRFSVDADIKKKRSLRASLFCYT